MIRRIAVLQLLAALCLSTSAAAVDVRTTETIPIAPWTTYMAVDTVTGRLFTSNLAFSAGLPAPGSVSVVDTDGTKRTFRLEIGPTDIALGVGARKFVAVQPPANQVTVIDADTLALSSYPTGTLPIKAIVVDSKNRAYAIGRYSGNEPVYARPFVGSLTEIDFATGAAHTLQIPDYEPVMVVSNGSKVFVIGQRYAFAQAYPTFIQAYDIASGTFGPVVPLTGRRPVDIKMSTSGQEIYILGHADYMRYPNAGTPAQGSQLELSGRGALFVIDAASLATTRTTLLPDFIPFTIAPEGYFVTGTPVIMGNSAIDPLQGNVYALDSYNKQFSIVDSVTGEVTRIGTEEVASTLAFDPVHRALYLSYPYAGYLGVYSAEGARLDTVPTAPLPVYPDRPSFFSQTVVNTKTGTVYVSNPTQGSVTVLRTPESATMQAFNATDVWWNPEQSGWGLYAEQQGLTMFAAVFARDAAGNPTWYAMTDGKRIADGSFRGKLYRTQGPTPSAPMRATPVGEMAFLPDSAGGAFLWYSVDGAVKTSPVQRLTFAAERSCGWSETSEIKAGNFTSLWYQPENSGWGLATSQRGDAMFGVLFGYDAANQPTWSVMSNGGRTSGDTFSGELYRASGAGMASLGTMAIDFGAKAAMLSTVSGGKASSQPVQRQVFSPLTSACN